LIYVAFTFWLFLLLFAGAGVYRMLGRLTRPRWVDWALLPGTIVSEMSYIFGCLITGAEIRHARLIRPDSGGAGSSDPSGPQTEATPKLKVVGPVIAALVAIVGCMVAMVLLHALLGGPVLGEFIAGPGIIPSGQALPRTLALTWDGFWDALRGQVSLMQRMAETWIAGDWTNWRVPLFVYVALCLSIRLAPVSRPVRPTLLAAVLIAVVIALIGLISSGFRNLMADIWPLLTYVWTSLLLVLALCLLVGGVIHLVSVLTGRRRS
jgi:hypothetical protein